MCPAARRNSHPRVLTPASQAALSGRLRRPRCRIGVEHLETRLLLSITDPSGTPAIDPFGPVAIVPRQLAALDHVDTMGTLPTATQAAVPSTDTPASVSPPTLDVAQGDQSKLDPRASDEPPDRLWHATDLPTAGVTVVRGDLDPSSNDMMFRVPLDGETARLDITLSCSDPTQPLAEGITVYDHNGHALAKLEPGSGETELALTMSARLLGAQSGAIYVRVTLSSTAASSLSTGSTTAIGTVPGSAGLNPGSGYQETAYSPTAFILLVKRQTIPLPPIVSGQSVGSIVSGSVGSGESGTATPSTARTGQPRDEVNSPITLSGQLPSVVAVATGSLPSRSAAPLGGILGSSTEQTPSVIAVDTLVVDLALVDLPLDPKVMDVEAAARVALGKARAEDADLAPAAEAVGQVGVVALRGSGGVPLLGTSLVAQERRESNQDVGDLPAFAAAPPVVVPVALSDSEQYTGTENVTRRFGIKRVSVTAGLSIALAFVSSLALPDFTDPARIRIARRSPLRRYLKRAGRRIERLGSVGMNPDHP